MNGNTNKMVEVTEKTDTNADIDMKSQNEQNGDFSKDVNDIYNHFDNDTMTKQIFKSFIDKINIQINDYKQQLESCKNTNTNNKKKAASIPSVPKINVSELIDSAQLVTSFSNISGRSPKCKLSISFYPKFLTIISQNKHDQHSIKTLINYSDIDRIICVPEKNNDTLFYAKLNNKIPLNWRKSSTDSFAFAFEHSSDYEQEEDENLELTICNLNTSLPSVIKGNIESQFCRVISGLTNKNIDRHDNNLFRTRFEKQKLFYFEASIKFNKCCIYPLRCGIFISPKPLRFVSQTRIKYYQYPRKGGALRYFDLDIVLFPLPDGDEINSENSDNKNKKTKKKKKGENMISLTMIAKSEMNAIDHYFNCMKIALKEDGKPSPDRKNKNKNNNNNTSNHNNKEEIDDDGDENMSLSDTDDNEGSGDLTDSDDEDYKIEDDDYDYTDSNESDDDSDDEETDEEDDDIDMNEMSDIMKNVEMVERGESIVENDKNKNNNNNKNKKTGSKSRRKQKSPKKNVTAHKKSDKKARKTMVRRKRKRQEMETDGLNDRALQELKNKKNKNKKNKHKNKEIITIEDNDSDDFDILQARKRFKGSRKNAIGRKTASGEKGAKIVSKSISKKKSPKKSRKKGQCKDKSVEIIESPLSPAKKRKKKSIVSSASSTNSSPRKIKSKVQNKKRKKKNKKNKKKNENQRKLVDMFAK